MLDALFSSISTSTLQQLAVPANSNVSVTIIASTSQSLRFCRSVALASVLHFSDVCFYSFFSALNRYYRTDTAARSPHHHHNDATTSTCEGAITLQTPCAEPRDETIQKGTEGCRSNPAEASQSWRDFGDEGFDPEQSRQARGGI